MVETFVARLDLLSSHLSFLCFSQPDLCSPWCSSDPADEVVDFLLDQLVVFLVLIHVATFAGLAHLLSESEKFLGDLEHDRFVVAARQLVHGIVVLPDAVLIQRLLHVLIDITLVLDHHLSSFRYSNGDDVEDRHRDLIRLDFLASGALHYLPRFVTGLRVTARRMRKIL